MLRELLSLDWYGKRLREYSKKHSRKNLYEFLSEAIATHCGEEEQTILNIGAGGGVQRHLETHRLHFTSVDVDPDRKPDLVLDVEDMHAIGDASADAIICIEVLEHVKNPQVAVAEMRRVLKPGGVVIGSTPFVFGMHDHPHDYYRYTRYGLQYLFRDYQRLQLKERNGYFQAVTVLCLRLFNIGTDRQRRVAYCLAPLLLCLVPLFCLLNLVVRSEDATSGYFFVFRKRQP